jgi:hypothetical protein
MSQQESTKPTESQEQTANKGVSVELPQEVVIAIADYLDVHIEMDLYQKQCKE